MTYLTTKQINIIKQMLDSLSVMDVPNDFVNLVAKYLDRGDPHLTWADLGKTKRAQFYDYTLEIEEDSGDALTYRIKVGDDIFLQGTPVFTFDKAEAIILDFLSEQSV